MGIMGASFNAEEQQLIDRLRSKYSRDETCSACDVGTALDQPAPPTAESTSGGAQIRSGSNVDAQVCAHCQGTGTIVEIYNHRRLENYCQHCQGRGVRVYKNGVEVQEGGSSSSSVQNSSTAQGAAGVVAMHRAAAAGAGAAAGDDGELDAEEVAARAEKLRAELQMIAEKAAAYNKERAVAQALVAADGGDGGRADAARALVLQLDTQRARLEGVRARKQAQLQHLEARMGSA